uniref:Early dehydration-responsive 1 n=1 Tax=Lindernia subracemosa TaxID=303139 RepID=A0A097HTR6_9LAMI|nr:early dehydration-responsive 1 [Lindernia subracemosa]
MSTSTVRPVACRVAPVNRANGSDPKASRVDMSSRKSAAAALQMKEMEKPLSQENSMSASRRGMMHLTALSLGLASLVSPLVAEASPGKRQKITKKLQELKEKAGLSKPKDKEDKKPTSKDKSEEKKKAKGDDKDKKIQPKNDAPKSLPKTPLQEPLLIPSLPNILNDKTVET